MKLSTKGRYGIRLMIDLADHYGGGPVLLRDIAKREAISEKYLWHLINPLKGVGLVTAQRGVHGGYTLAKAPSEIFMNEILQVLEGPLCLVDCVEKPSTCKRTSVCVAHDLWGEATVALAQILKKYNLADMVERRKIKREKLSSDHYMI